MLSGALDRGRSDVDALLRAATGLCDPDVHLPKSLRDRVTKLTPTVEALKSVLAPGHDSVDSLVAIDAAVRDLRNYVDDASRWLARFAHDANEKLSGGRSLAKEIAKAAAVEQGSDVTAGVGNLTNAFDVLYRILDHAVGKLGDPNGQSAQQSLKVGEYLDCVAKIEQFSQPAMGSTPAFALPPIPPQRPAAVAAAQPPPKPSAPGNPATQLPLYDGRVERRSRWANRIQQAFAYAVIPLVALVIYGPSFVGTLAEVVALFAAAFMLDFTSDTAVAWLDRQKKA
jgi:hypothetical protein